MDTGSLSGIVDDMRARGTVLRRSSIGAVNKRGIRTWHFAVPRTKNSLAVAAKNWSDGYSSTRVEDVDAVTMTRNEAIIITTNKDLSLLDFDRSGRHLVAIGRPHARNRTVVLFRWHGGQLIRWLRVWTKRSGKPRETYRSMVNMYGMIRCIVSPSKKVTYTLPEDVVARIGAAVARGGAPSQSALVSEAVTEYLARKHEEWLKSEWEAAARDPDFMRDVREVMEDFRYADAETWARIDDDEKR